LAYPNSCVTNKAACSSSPRHRRSGEGHKPLAREPNTRKRLAEGPIWPSIAFPRSSKCRASMPSSRAKHDGSRTAPGRGGYRVAFVRHTEAMQMVELLSY
jgi:hypothetical protein